MNRAADASKASGDTYKNGFSTLDNPILPLFRVELWNRDQRDVYAALEPGLRLASLFLTDRAIIQYWHTLISARRFRFNYATASSTRPRTQGTDEHLWIRAPSRVYPTSVGKVLACLEQLADDVEFRFDDIGALFGRYSNAQGPDGALQHTIRLHTSFYDTARDMDTEARPAVLRFNFLFAVVVVHEVAHAVDRLISGSDQESYCLDHWWAEAGLAWETEVLGGVVYCSTSDDNDVTGHLYVRVPEEEESPGSQYPNMDTEKHPIPISYLRRIQNRDAWSDPDRHVDFCKYPGLLNDP